MLENATPGHDGALESARAQIAHAQVDVLLFMALGMTPLTFLLAQTRLARVQVRQIIERLHMSLCTLTSTRPRPRPRPRLPRAEAQAEAEDLAARQASAALKLFLRSFDASP